MNFATTSPWCSPSPSFTPWNMRLFFRLSISTVSSLRSLDWDEWWGFSPASSWSTSCCFSCCILPSQWGFGWHLRTTLYCCCCSPSSWWGFGSGGSQSTSCCFFCCYFSPSSFITSMSFSAPWTPHDVSSLLSHILFPLKWTLLFSTQLHIALLCSPSFFSLRRVSTSDLFTLHSRWLSSSPFWWRWSCCFFISSSFPFMKASNTHCCSRSCSWYICNSCSRCCTSCFQF